MIIKNTKEGFKAVKEFKCSGEDCQSGTMNLGDHSVKIMKELWFLNVSSDAETIELFCPECTKYAVERTFGFTACVSCYHGGKSE